MDLHSYMQNTQTRYLASHITLLWRTQLATTFTHDRQNVAI